MRIQIVTPAPRGSTTGNRITATRWARLLRQLGHQVRVVDRWSGPPDTDVLIALHARKSFTSIAEFQSLEPVRPLIVGLAGTDLYQDLSRSSEARQALAWADRIVTLQPVALERLSAPLRSKARSIFQSAVPASGKLQKSIRSFDICVIGHLRAVKDPFRTALAARQLPPESRIRVLHAGQALTDGMRSRAEREMAINSRYRWLGSRPHWQVRRVIARSHAMVNSSQLEGGANVVSEAAVAGIPILASRIDGSRGMLGDDHTGFFEPGATAELTALLNRCETDGSFLADLGRRSAKLAPRFTPEREKQAWADLLDELA